MSAQEQQQADPHGLDPTSSFEVGTTAKGTFQWKLKVRAVSNDDSDIRRAFALQMELAEEMAKKYGGLAGAA